MNPPRTTAAAPVDLGRLRIARGSEERGRVRGFNPLWLIVLLGLGGAAYLFRDEIWAKVEQARAGAPLRTARAERVTPGAIKAGDVAANGYVIADRSASLASVISGRLVELNAKEGDTVEKDEVVARVQYDDLEAAEAEAKARTVTAEATAAQVKKSIEAALMDVPRVEADQTTLSKLVAEAKENADRLAREVERNRPLVPRIVTAEAFERLESQARAAQRALEAAEARVAANVAALTSWSGEIARREAELKVAEANVEAAKRAEASAAILVEKTRIRAPFRGLVVRKDAEKGEVIAPTGGGANSKGSVLTIVDPESLEMQVELNERQIASVAEGDTAGVKMDADTTKTWPAKVRKIWPRADRSKGTIEVRVVFKERPPYARPDMAGQVVFQGKQAAAASEPPYVTVPLAAVVKRGTADVVFVVEGGAARQVPVTLGAPKPTAPTSAIVLSGLSGGETVLLSPAATLVDGEQVGSAPK
jgi:RND family efflux transporter MFP subunit